MIARGGGKNIVLRFAMAEREKEEKEIVISVTAVRKVWLRRLIGTP